MSATPSIQVSTPSISLATLRAALAELQAQEPERGIRWVRAATIVALRRIEPGVAAGWWVESECEPGRVYWVYRPAVAPVEMCICEDYKQRGGPCKHALAVRLFNACQEREAARETPAPIPFPVATLDPDAPIPFVLTDKALAELDRPDPEDPEPTPIRGSRLGDGSYWGTCKLCGDIGVIAYNGRGVCCVS
jgi:hypothetical protein